MLGQSVGLSAEQMAAMGDADSPLFDETEALVLRYAQVLTRDNKVDDALYGELEKRFSKNDLFELCMTIGLSGLVNRVHATFKTDLDAETAESVEAAGLACPMSGAVGAK